MKKFLTILFLVCFSLHTSFAQNSFKSGEFLKFKISYGLLNAGIATLTLKDTLLDGRKLIHAAGHGYTTGVPKLFFKVEDDYQSYFEQDKVTPYRFVRKIDEGGYTKDQEGFFNYSTNTVLVKDYKSNTENIFNINYGVQDIVSAFYYLRDQPELNQLKKGDSVEIDMFFDQETFRFKLEFLGEDVIRTHFGKVKALMFRPYVMAGRVFKAKESLTIWVSKDANKVPLRIKASLAVGSLKADLVEYEGLMSDLEIELK
ncbi:DUF3108 domain-containing protein [Myroides sp. LJL116]